VNRCFYHSNRPACDESDGWDHGVCRDCWDTLGEPGIEPQAVVFNALRVMLDSTEMGRRLEHSEHHDIRAALTERP